MKIFRPQGDLIICLFFVLPIVPRLKACPMIFLPGAPVGKTGEYSLILSTKGFDGSEAFLKKTGRSSAGAAFYRPMQIPVFEKIFHRPWPGLFSSQTHGMGNVTLEAHLKGLQLPAPPGPDAYPPHQPAGKTTNDWLDTKQRLD